MLSDVPVRTGYLEAQAGWTDTAGAYARAEAGARLATNLGAFAFAEASQRGGTMAGVGARVTFGL